jgi:WD40 repeat protein
VDQSVLGLCTTADNKLLGCGDTDGFITIYDITTYCMQNSDVVQPEVKWKWNAHQAPVVSLECIENIAAHTFILSASVDLTARLWTIRGVAVGVFGQGDLWNLTDLSTWHTCEEIDGLQTMNMFNTEKKMADTDHSNTGTEIETHAEQTVTTTDEGHISPRISLGTRFNDHLIRIKSDRKVRRDHLGDIDFSHTNPSKTLCCPFQAVATTTLATVSVPFNLPLTSRLIQCSSENNTTTKSSSLTVNRNYYQ